MKQIDRIKVILADDHEIFRDGFKIMVQKSQHIELIAEASNGLELLKLVRSFEPDIVVTDIKMPELNGIEATKQLKKEFPALGIIALSMFGEEDLIVDMLEAGARGYLIKNAQKDEIISAIESVYEGETYYCRHTTNKLSQMIAQSNYNPHQKKSKPDFTEKELTIIKLICQEHSSSEIGEKMKLSSRTIEGYREKILEKIEARNTAGIVVYALKHKLYE